MDIRLKKDWFGPDFHLRSKSILGSFHTVADEWLPILPPQTEVGPFASEVMGASVAKATLRDFDDELAVVAATQAIVAEADATLEATKVVGKRLPRGG